MPLTDTIIWGTKCLCGNDCYILQTEHHPWQPSSYSVNVKCPVCGRENEIDQALAANFYNSKIYEFFSPLSGIVLDYGCGGGFLTQFAFRYCDKVYSCDIIPECEKEILRISPQIKFINSSYQFLTEYLPAEGVDELISRDVVMFIEHPDKFIKKICSIVHKRIRLLAWYNPAMSKMKNDFTPQQMRNCFLKENWKTDLKILNWYAWGYTLTAEKNNI